MTRNCKNCGKQLPRDATSRRKYCCDVCRVQYSRARSVQSEYNELMGAIGRLGSAKAGDKIKALEILREAKKQIDFMLLVLGDRDAQDKFDMLNNRSQNR